MANYFNSCATKERYPSIADNGSGATLANPASMRYGKGISHRAYNKMPPLMQLRLSEEAAAIGGLISGINSMFEDIHESVPPGFDPCNADSGFRSHKDLFNGLDLSFDIRLRLPDIMGLLECFSSGDSSFQVNGGASANIYFGGKKNTLDGGLSMSGCGGHQIQSIDLFATGDLKLGPSFGRELGKFKGKLNFNIGIRAPSFLKPLINFLGCGMCFVNSLKSGVGITGKFMGKPIKGLFVKDPVGLLGGNFNDNGLMSGSLGGAIDGGGTIGSLGLLGVGSDITLWGYGSEGNIQSGAWASGGFNIEGSASGYYKPQITPGMARISLGFKSGFCNDGDKLSYVAVERIEHNGKYYTPNGLPYSPNGAEKAKYVADGKGGTSYYSVKTAPIDLPKRYENEIDFNDADDGFDLLPPKQ